MTCNPNVPMILIVATMFNPPVSNLKWKVFLMKVITLTKMTSTLL